MEPDESTLLGQIMARTAELERASKRLEEAIGCLPDDEHPTGEGIRGVVNGLQQCIGRAPNPATGEIGSGLCGVVAELAVSHRVGQAKMFAGGAIGAGSVVAVIELVLRLVQAVGG